MHAIRSLLGRENDALNDESDTHQPPDTGFKLIPLIRSVLDTSDATETDELAMEVLGKIPTYDRETALFQALRQLVRTSFRPAFIPQAPKDVTTGAVVPGQRTAEDPPPERDGRQWLAKPWEQVREERPPDEERVSAVRAVLDAAVDATLRVGPIAEDLERRAAESDSDEVELMSSDEVLSALEAEPAKPPSPALTALGQSERAYTRADTPAIPTRPAPRRWNPAPPPSPAKSSPRVAAIREAWRKTLRQRISVETGHKFFGDCTVMDLEYAAGQREQHAKRTQARADELRKLVVVMRKHDVATLKDLPVEVLADLESSLVTAAA